MLILIINEEGTRLIEHYYLEMNNELMGVAYSILRDRFEAESAVQEAFTKIITSLESFQKVPDDKKSGYCYMVVKNISINMYNKDKKINLSVLYLEDSFAEAALTDESIEERAELKEEIAAMKFLINRLDDSLRKPLLLRFANGFTYKQISDVLSISESLARKRVERAIAKLGEKTKEAI